MVGVDVGLINGVVSPLRPIVGAGVGMAEDTGGILQNREHKSFYMYTTMR